MTTWSKEELPKIAEADDLHISPFREDGTTYGTPTWIWSVAVDGALYVRGYNGRASRWYQAAARQKAGRIVAAGMTKEVTFEPVDGSINDLIVAEHSPRPCPLTLPLARASVLRRAPTCHASVGSARPRRDASRQRSDALVSDHESSVVLYLAGSTERLTLTGCRSDLDRVQHAMARDGVVERGAETRSLAIVASETRVRLGDVGGRARALRRRPPILFWHGQDLEEDCAPLPPCTVISKICAWPPAAVSCRSPSVPLISQSRLVPRERPPR